jgi:hypothetical protein
MRADTRRRLFWLSLFSIAMAQLEATVVVYLRKIYYPDGFDFPLVIIRDRIAAIEIGREVATIVMLFTLAKLYSVRDRWRQYAAFLWAFGLWDIFYYVWLWIMLRWPSSLLDLDVLFLIPLPWVGPVLAPVLIALIMMAAGWSILLLRDADRSVVVSRLDWVVTIVGAMALIALFAADAGAVMAGKMPAPFRWSLFTLFLIPPMIVATRAFRRSCEDR